MTLHRSLLVLLVPLILAGPTAAQRKAPEDLAPANTLLFMKLADAAAVRPFLDGTHAIFKEPWLRNIMDKAQWSPAKMAEEFQKETGLVLAEILAALEGPVGVAVLGKEDFLDQPEVLVAIGVKNDEKTPALWPKIRARIEEKHAAEIARTEDEDINGLPVWRMELKAGEDRTEKTWFCLHGGQFLISNHRESMAQATLVLQDKDVPALGAKKDFAATMARLGPARDVSCYLDLPGVLAQSLTGSAASKAKSQKVLAALGIDAIKALGLGGGLTPDSVELAMTAYAPGKRTGILKLLSPNCPPLAPDRFAPAEAVQAGVLWLDLPNLVSEIKGLAESLEPGSGEEIDAWLGMAEEQTGVDIQKDILALLLPPLHVVSMPGGEGEKEDGPGTLLYARSPEAKKLMTTLKDLVAKFSEGLGTLEEKEYLGNPICSFAVDPEAMPPGVQMPSVAMAATDTHFFLSLGGAAQIERAFRTLGKEVRPLTDTPEYKRAMAGFPERSWALAFTRLDMALAGALRSLRGLAEMAPGEAEFMQILQPLLAMDPKTIGRYVQAMAVSMASDPNGLHFGMRVTMPAAKATPKEPPK